MADGNLNFDTTIDPSGVNNAGKVLKNSLSRIAKEMARAFGGKPTAAAEKNIQKLKEKYDEATAAVERQREAIARLQAEQAAAPAARQAEANAKIAELEPQAAAWKERYESKDAQALHLYNNGQANSEEFKELRKEAEEAYKEYEKISAQIEKIKSQTAALTSKEAAAYTGKIEAANTKLAQLEEQAAKTKDQMQQAMDEKQPSRFSKSLSKTTGSLTKFTHRVAGLAKRVLVFSVITRLLRSLRTLLSGMFGSNSQLTASLARIKGNLLTAFQPIYEYILPGIQKVLAVIEVVTAKLAALSAALFGKSVTQMQQNAKALNDQATATKKAGKEAEKAKRSLAGFDELNQLSGNEKDADSESETKGADFSGKVSDLTAQEQKIATYALLLLGTGLLMIGIFTANFTMILTGALLIKQGLDLGKSSGAFDSTPPWLKQIITWGGILCGLGLMVLGALMPVPNVQMILMGAAMMAIAFSYGKASGAFDSMPGWLKQVVTWGATLAGLGLLIAGIVTGQLPLIALGIGLLGLGIAFGIATGAWSEAFSAISGFFKNLWSWLKDFWNNHVAKIFTKEFWSGLWQKIIDALIMFVDWLDEKLTTAGDNLRAWWNAHIGFFFTGEWWAQKWQNVKNAAHQKVTEIKTGIVNAFTAVRERIDQILESIRSKFSDVWTGIKTLVVGVVNGVISAIEGLVNGLIRGVNKMVQAINAIHVDIPDWVPTYGGKRIGFNLPTIKEVTIPRLATGTVVPANYGEYMAILGDNKREPEVVSPLSTIKQAVIEAVTQINNGNQPMTVVINLDGATIGKAALKYQQGRKVQMGAKT